MEEENAPTKLRVSIRFLLITILLAGAMLGMLGRWYLRAPEWFAAAVGLLSTVVPYFVAAGVLIWAGKKRRVPGGVLLGLAIIAAPFVGAGVLFIAQDQINQYDLSGKPFEELVNVHLQRDIEDWNTWYELEARQQSGDLTPKQTNDVLRVFADYLDGLTVEERRDYYWSAQNDFVSQAASDGVINEEVLLRICDAYYLPEVDTDVRGKPTATDRQIDLDVGVRLANSSYDEVLSHRLVWWPTGAQIEERPGVATLASGDAGLQPQAVDEAYNDSHSNWLGQLQLSEPLGEGDHTLLVEIEYAYLDESKLLGLGDGAIPNHRWPKALKRWKETAKTKLSLDEEEPAKIALSDNPAHDPMKTGAVRVGRLVLQAEEAGTSRLVLELDSFDSDTIPLAFTVHAKINGQEHPLGKRVSTGGCGCEGSDSPSATAVLSTPAASVVTAELEFRPDADLVKDADDVQRIWGERLLFRGVPVERLDLEAQQETEAQRETSEVAAAAHPPHDTHPLAGSAPGD